MISEIIILVFILVLSNLVFLIKFNTLSRIIKIFDYPNEKRKTHKKPIPLIGGIIIFVNFIFSLVFLFLKDQNLVNYFYIFSNKIFLIFLITVLIIFLTGIYDDKFSLSPIKRLFFITFSTYVLIKTDHTLILNELFFSSFNMNVRTNSLDLIFTLMCIISLILALNMFDGINLQSGIFYLLFFSFCTFVTKNSFFILIIIPILFFLYLNFKNKTFLGDSGSYLLSFLVCFFSIKIYKYEGYIYADHILTILLLPILDAVRVTLQRLYAERKIFEPDRIHFHHLLLKKYNYTRTIIIISVFFLFPYLCFFLKINSILTITVISFFYFYLLKKK